jgi:TnpA family transposase
MTAFFPQSRKVRLWRHQQHRVSGLNLLVTTIILWNMRYLERATTASRQTEDVPDHLLALCLVPADSYIRQY